MIKKITKIDCLPEVLMKKSGLIKQALLVLSLIMTLFLAARLMAQTSPEAFLGFKVGEDRKLVDYNQIVAYFQKLDQETPKLKLFEIGKSTLGKPMIMAVITAEENMSKLDEYREISRRLKMASGLSTEEARKLAARGKTILLITCSLHATEIAASQMSLEFAYNLVTGKTPFDADKILQDVIVLLMPSINPDGNIMVTEWYRKYVGTKYEGSNMPWLYHHYAGHDNNRDWFMFNLVETRAVTKVLYHDWHPQIHIDEHQMGSTGARFFIPPFMDPPLPNIHPLVWRGVNLCGMNMAFDLQKNGFKGVVHGRSFTGWWIGACDDTSWLHNTIGLLSEAASVRIASPIYIEPTEVSRDYAEKRMDFIDPWPGGWWRLRDIVDYELTISMSLVKTSALYKDDFLFNSYLISRDSIEKVEKNQPFGFVINADQPDLHTTLRLLDILKFGGVEIHQAKEPFIADGRYYPAGSFVVLMAQPYKAYAWALLEKQKYPDMRQYPGGPPIPPYDNAGWTLPLQMGVVCDQINQPFEAKMEKLENIPYPVITIPSESDYFLLDSKTNASYGVAIALLKKGIELQRVKKAVRIGNFAASAGSFIVKNTPEIRKELTQLVEKWKVKIVGLDEANFSSFDRTRIILPRIALYQSWRGNMDEGWTRYVFDDFSIPYKTIRNSDFKGAKGKKVSLKSNFDVIVFASENPDIIKTGRPSQQQTEFARFITPLPPEYEGGIDKDGVEALKTFVEEGGIVITMNQACGLAITDLQVPARNAIERVERTRFFCPTSILKLQVDNETPVGWGFDKTAAAMFVDSLALDTWIPPNEWTRKVVASYPEEGVLLSGWLLGEDLITRKAAVVDTSFKKGRIILIGIRSQHRAQSHGTYKFLFNSLLYPQTP